MWHALRNLLRHRVLVQSLVARELKARYRGTVLGFFWSFVNPLLLLAVYWIVFAYIFTPPRAEAADTDPYALFMFCGLLPWTWFQSSMMSAANSLTTGGNLIKKLVFPAEVLPVVSVLSEGVHYLLGLPIYLSFWILYKGTVTAHVLWFPLIVAVQLIFTLGLGMFFAALAVHFRDVRDLLANVLTLWFFSTPIIYSLSVIDHDLLRSALEFNPMTNIIEAYQHSIFAGTLIPWKRFGVTALVAVALFVIGYTFFDRLRDSFPEEV